MDNEVPTTVDQLQAENQRLKEQVAALRSAADGDSTAVSIGGIETMTLRLGADGRVEYANSAMAHLAGVEKSALVGADVSSLHRCLPDELARPSLACHRIPRRLA